MPGPRRKGGRRTEISDWRVKAGSKEVFSHPVKFKCEQFIRDSGGKLNGVKLRLIPPNS